MTKFNSLLILMCTGIFGLSLFPNHVLAQTETSIVDRTLSAMTLEQKVGQLFIIGFPQSSYDARLEEVIDKVKPGAFLFFKRNIHSLNQLKVLNAKIASRSLKSSKVKPFLAVDQEGGAVVRVPSQPPLPSAMALGQTNSSEIAAQYGEEIGNLIKEYGFNMNLAPVLDLSNPFEPSFIGGRSLGGNPENVADLGTAIATGLLKSQVVPTAKHFPGLGSSYSDPHATLATRVSSLEDFLTTDLKPYERYAALGPNSAVMLSHLSYPALDPANVPAVFSEKIVKELLRDKLKFKGLVVTDDLMMQGASQFAKPEDAAVMALKAGSDIIMVTWSVKAQVKAFERVMKAVHDKELPIEIVDEKVKRILSVKAAMNLLTETPPGRTLATKKFSHDRLREIEQVILDLNLKSQSSKFQMVKTTENFCVFSSNRTFLNSFRRGTSLKMKYLFMATSTTSSGLERAMEKNSCNRAMVTIYGKKTLGLLKTLNPISKAKILIVNLSAPHIVADEDSYLAVINLYFPHVNAGQKVAQHIVKGSQRKVDSVIPKEEEE